MMGGISLSNLGQILHVQIARVTTEAEKCDSLDQVVLRDCCLNAIMSKVLASSRILILRTRLKAIALPEYHGGSCKLEVNGTENRCSVYE